jgi:hypothetical protein
MVRNSSTDSENTKYGDQEEPWGRLVFFEKGQVFDLFCEEYTIGRSPNCDIAIKDKQCTISNFHFLLQRAGKFCILTDNNSTNGTFVNGVKVTQIPLIDKAEIKICFDFHFLFLYKNTKVELLDGRYYIFNSVLLGTGAFADVHLSFDTVETKPLACKVVNLKSITQPKDKLIKEVEMLKQCRHWNIIQIQAMTMKPKKMYIHMELIKGRELFDLIARQKLSEIQILSFFYQLTDAVGYLHQHGICHRDIKAENIMLQQQIGVDDPWVFGRLVLVDFGLSTDHASKMSTICGTCTYIAPEIFDSNVKYNEKVDIWAMGVLLYTSNI